MNEWDFNKNEFYLALVADSEYSNSGILFIVITESSTTYKWKGWLISEEDVNKFSDITFDD